jgi:class 3 adenylate cyclase/tetratricopeptide (TPR) repeat protein
MPQNSDEREQLERAIAALEAQRPILGDEVVATSLEALRQKLAALNAIPPRAQRKQVTVLFADFASFTAMTELMDPEDVTGLMNALWQRLDAAILLHGGRIDKHMGDAVMALWGAEQAQEDDPEQAVCAALAMQQAIADFEMHLRPWQFAEMDVRAHDLQAALKMRIGVSTGPALLGAIATTEEFTAMGDAVNLAARLEHLAPPGSVLIAHDTYRQVQGAFEVEALEPIQVKGKQKPVLVYLVKRPKPRAARLERRGVEGIATRMFGREHELKQLQEAYRAVRESGQQRMITLMGEAGVGKSRLLYEFQARMEPRPEGLRLFKGRAEQARQNLPYALLRDIFSFPFQIQDSDPPQVLYEKIERGVGEALAAEDARMKAHFIGHLLGFDFSNSPYIHGILRDTAQIRDRALAYLSDYCKAVLSAHSSGLLLLEDLHWADDSSLQALEYLGRALEDYPLLVLGAARPALLERRPKWGDTLPFQRRIEVKPLSQADTYALVNDILQKVTVIPNKLSEMVVNSAEGNPFYVEELIKILIEDRVIVCDETHWQVDLARLATVRIPSTLLAVLQARFDTLSAGEKLVLQQAAVIGRTFWDDTVRFLGQPESQPADSAARAAIHATLATLCSREMIYRHERSLFAETQEHAFKHTLLRDATYESVLKSERRTYHARVAKWLIQNSGERADEYAGLIAEHLERAGRNEQAARYLQQAGEAALRTSAYREAAAAFKRALALFPPEGPEQAALMIRTGETLVYIGNYVEAGQYLKNGLALAQKHGDNTRCAEALAQLGQIAHEQGDWGQARAWLGESLALGQKLGAPGIIANARDGLGWVSYRVGDLAAAEEHFTASYQHFQAADDRRGQARTLNGLGIVAKLMGDYQKSRELRQRSLALHVELGDRRGAGLAINGLGEAARMQGDYATAREHYQEASAIFHEIGDPTWEAIVLGNLGHTALAQHDDAAAQGYYHRTLKLIVATGAIPSTLDALAGLAGVLARTGQPERAMQYLGLALNHPGYESDTQPLVDAILAELEAQYPAQLIKDNLARGARLDLAQTIAEILQNN